MYGPEPLLMYELKVFDKVSVNVAESILQSSVHKHNLEYEVIQKSHSKKSDKLKLVT